MNTAVMHSELEEKKIKTSAWKDELKSLGRNQADLDSDLGRHDERTPETPVFPQAGCCCKMHPFPRA